MSVQTAQPVDLSRSKALATTQLMLDVSRLLWSTSRSTPSGIERVELAYAERFLADLPDQTNLVAWSYGRCAVVAAADMRALVGAFRRVWQNGSRAEHRELKLLAQAIRLKILWSGNKEILPLARSRRDPCLYLTVSTHLMDKPKTITRFKRATHARLITFIHDLIPITHPEYGRDGGADRHRVRMETAARFADGIIVNSSDTLDQFRPFLADGSRQPHLAVAPLAVEASSGLPRTGSIEHEAYFICLGTIEPRKNHLLLLNIWRRLVSQLGSAAPTLLIVGRRGWENENIIDMIDRCEAIKPFIREFNYLPDRQVATLLKGARALLLPSFAEGYGLPVPEALANGVPVICSDLPALREIAGAVAEYIDPLDGAKWQDAIIDYAQPASPRRAAQIDRIGNWRAPTWDAHFAAVESLIEHVAAGTPAAGTAAAPASPQLYEAVAGR